MLVIAVDVSAGRPPAGARERRRARRRRPDGVRRRRPAPVPRRAAVRRGVRQPPVRPDRRAAAPGAASSRSSRRSALDGGPDGLDVVRRLIDRLPAVTGSGRRRVPRDRRGPGRRDRRRRSRTRIPGCALHRDARPRRAARASCGSTCARVSATRRGRARWTDLRAGDRPEPAFPVRLIALDIDGTVDRARLPDLRPHGRGDPRGRGRAACTSRIATGRMAELGGGLREPAGADRPDRRPPGRRRPRDAAGTARHRPRRPAVPRAGRAHPAPHADGRRGRRARRSPGAWRTASTRTSTTWSGSSSGAATPRFEDYSGYLGPEADIVARPRGARSASRSRRSSRSGTRRGRWS